MNLFKTWLGFFFTMFFCTLGFSQIKGKGNLFIIGGGSRSAALMDEMVKTAAMKSSDYIVFLPMASTIPDEGFAYFKKGFSNHPDLKVVMLKFAKEDANHNLTRIDSVKKAKLIYFAGGDQNRFMDVVRGTKLYDAIHQAYKNGSTIAGTSAGAAVMSKIMLTGEPVQGKEFNVIWNKNVETAEGMGFLTGDIVDQHFIKRSRFNRLISVLAMNPEKQAIGIDESTAIICHNGKAKVTGEGQVVVLSKFKDLDAPNQKLVSFENVNFALLKAGDEFELKTKK